MADFHSITLIPQDPPWRPTLLSRLQLSREIATIFQVAIQFPIPDKGIYSRLWGAVEVSCEQSQWRQLILLADCSYSSQYQASLS